MPGSSRFTRGIAAFKTIIAKTFKAETSQDLNLQTVTDSKTVKLNSRNYTQTSGDSIGFQSKPAQTIGSSGSIFGCQISPRINDTIALSDSGSIVGLHADAYLKGTSAGAIGGDVRAANLELVTDDGGVRAITGNVSFIRCRAAFSANSIGGKFTVIRVEKPETQTNSKTLDAIMEFTDTLAGVYNDDPGTEPSTAAGYLKVLVNGNARYIQLYSGAPVD